MTFFACGRSEWSHVWTLEQFCSDAFMNGTTAFKLPPDFSVMNAQQKYPKHQVQRAILFYLNYGLFYWNIT